MTANTMCVSCLLSKQEKIISDYNRTISGVSLKYSRKDDKLVVVSASEKEFISDAVKA